VAFAADTLRSSRRSSITPHPRDPWRTDAGLLDPLFWGALAFAPRSRVAAFPVNRWLIGRGLAREAMEHRAPPPRLVPA
jgi:hypothetical protein